MIEIDEQVVSLRDARSVRICGVTAEHAAAFSEFMRAVSEESPWSGMMPSEVRSQADQRKAFEEQDEDGLHWRLGVWDDSTGMIVGDCSMTRTDRAKFCHVARLGIGVRDGWRGVGLGRIMMERALDTARRDPDILRLELLVFAKNSIARSLYLSMGFVEEGMNIRSVRQSDGSFDDDVHMAIWVGD